MPHTVTGATSSLSALALLSILVACAPKEPADKTASKDSTTAAAATAGGEAASTAKIPITSASDEAKRLYTRGRDLSEQLRNQDARELFAQAVAKDSTFAMAHYNLALTSPTTKEFLEHLKHAVALAGKASDGERLLILSTEAGAKADPAKALQYLEEVVSKYPKDERAHMNLGNAYVGRQQND